MRWIHDEIAVLSDVDRRICELYLAEDGKTVLAKKESGSVRMD